MLNPMVKKIGEDVMGFLNEIQLKYPEATSFASGRPDEKYFDIKDFPKYFNIYVDAKKGSGSRRKVLNGLGQYNRTKGIINAEVAQYLKKDERINAKPADIVITVGAQEAMCLSVMTLCDQENDVIIVEDPAYIGITNFAILGGYNVAPVAVDGNGISLVLLEKKIKQLRKDGKNVKLVYVIPDFQNPTGNSMPLNNRKQLLALATKYNFFILEDNAYSEFRYEGARILPIKAYDTENRVLYMRSFSKTLYPSLRLGALVAGQTVQHQGKDMPLSDLLAQTKGYITVNTPSINQAVLGGMLIRNNFSLKHMNKEKVESIGRKRNLLLAALKKFLSGKDNAWAGEVSWNIPRGGFFITIHLPFEVSREDVIQCTEQYGVIFTPMWFFYLGAGGKAEIRLAFSNIDNTTIEPAIQRLAAFIKSKL